MLNLNFFSFWSRNHKGVTCVNIINQLRVAANSTDVFIKFSFLILISIVTLNVIHPKLILDFINELSHKEVLIHQVIHFSTHLTGFFFKSNSFRNDKFVTKQFIQIWHLSVSPEVKKLFTAYASLAIILTCVSINIFLKSSHLSICNHIS